MYKKILMPLDGSELAECVLSHVDGFVADCRAETIVFVRVVKPASFYP
jgi:nucleotide-binding universal stress UspA family protein